MTIKSKNILVVCGPTASGKTKLAVDLALRYGGEIISADSRQVYRGMDIGTGKDLDEYSRAEGKVPYHLIDIADPEQIYTLYDYLKDFEDVYKELLQRKVLPVLAGGTGLYVEAVLKDYDVPSVPEDPQLRDTLMKEDKERLIEQLAALDPEIYRKTDCSSKKRVVRALEVAIFKKDNPESTIEQKRSLQLDPCVLCVTWEREVLRERIDKRLDKRLKQGMVEEVKRLLASGVSEERFSLFGMEYKHVARYIKNQVTYKTMVKELRTSIHHLAKRQETWFRGMEKRGIEVHWIRNGDLQEAIAVADRYFVGDGLFLAL